ncbi:MOSC domain-containing protein [Salinibaculum salinum]|uniref:MOSC domain-containing protein n=1 Tax=Salinibaculum salinum TaxID=3131996 RepID=UPI0030EF87B4
MARLERLTVYPVKGLSGSDIESATVLDGGTLASDREYALFDADGDVINGKRTARVHELTTAFDRATDELRVETPAGECQRFDLDSERDRAEAWFEEFFDTDLTLRRDETLGFVDRRDMGPSVISTGTLRTVASWFDRMTVESARRRLRANVEISGVPAFWEDRFVGDDAPTFDVGGVRFEGVTPCGRCVVPQRDPDTGESIARFRETFIEKRQETFPDWTDEAAFDHYYTTMIITQIPAPDRGKTLRVGDTVESET